MNWSRQEMKLKNNTEIRYIIIIIIAYLHTLHYVMNTSSHQSSIVRDVITDQ